MTGKGSIASIITQGKHDIDEAVARVREAMEASLPQHAVRIGTHATVRELVAAVKASGVVFEGHSERQFSGTLVSQTAATLRFVVVTVAELGFTGEVWPNEVSAHVTGYCGLRPCSGEAVLQLCRQHRQRDGEHLLVPAKLSGSEVRWVWVACRDGVQRVNSRHDNPFDRLRPYTRLAFVLPDPSF